MTHVHLTLSRPIFRQVSLIIVVKQGLYVNCLRPKFRRVLMSQRNENILVGPGQSWPIPRDGTQSVLPEPHVYNQWGIDCLIHYTS